MLSCLSCCPLSDPPLSFLYCVHLSIVGLAVLFFSPVCPHLTFFSQCNVLLFHSTHMAVPLQSFFCNFLGRLHHSCCPSNVFISDRIPPCHSAHQSQHPHLIYFYSCLLSPCCRLGLCTIQQSWSDHLSYFVLSPAREVVPSALILIFF